MKSIDILKVASKAAGLLAIAAYATLSFTSCNDKIQTEPEPDPFGGHENDLVDLCLPSGIKWAKFNVGASSPEESGDYFAWGETQTKEKYTLSTYKFWDSTYKTYTKYSTDASMTYCDDQKILLPEDDAAQASWHGNWYTPSDCDWMELLDYCTWEWRSWPYDETKKGYLVTSKINGNTIFIPAAGGYNGSELGDVGQMGIYRSSSVFCHPYYHEYDSNYAGSLYFKETEKDLGGLARFRGYSVRPVMKVPVASISMGATSLELGRYESASIVATILPENATNKKIIWSSSDPTRAIVDSDGKVSTLMIGRTTITAMTEEGGYIAQCEIRVVSLPPTSVSLDRTSLELYPGESAVLTATVYPDQSTTNKNVTWASDTPAVATVDQNGKVTAVKAGTATITVTTSDGKHSAQCTVTVKNGIPANDENCVDLGLPSGRKWATRNVGATVAADHGLYFLWGETYGRNYQNSHRLYKHCKEITGDYGIISYEYTKYCSDDNKKVLDPEDDAATANWGDQWRLPTEDECKELINKCTWTWDDTKKGFNVTGPNGKSIYLPAAGYCWIYDGLNYEGGSKGYYLSSSLSDYEDYAWDIYFTTAYPIMEKQLRRSGARSARAVVK